MKIPNKKPKILYVITKSNWGGAQKYVYDLAIALPKEKFDVAVAFGGTGLLKEMLDTAGINTISIPRLVRNISFSDEISVLLHLWHIVHSERPDILHVNSPKAAGLAAFLGRLLGVKKIIFTAHGWAFNEDRPLWQKTLIWFFSYLTVIFAHTTIVISEFEKTQTLRIMPLMKKKIVMIYNGLRPVTHISRKEAQMILELPPASQDAVWIGTIAELHRNKGLSYAIEGIHRLKEMDSPSLRYVIIGEGEERSALQELIEKLSLQNTVFLVGLKKDAATLLKAFDRFLLVSLKEGLPYTLLEAAQAGLPTICTTAGGSAEIVLNSQTGYVVTPRDPDAIMQALIPLLHNAKMRSELGDSLRTDTAKRFSFEKMLRKTLTLYLERKSVE